MEAEEARACYKCQRKMLFSVSIMLYTHIRWRITVLILRIAEALAIRSTISARTVA